ncbi:nitrate- and nitrite sensing domain-containing protein [Nonomuraea sp. NPDC050556]|uniref:sensor histidine kinase n=1 Tax=Nonomuraea sp. NPDC050556 TaxID=3364369 RepID=UPI003791B32F
MAKRGRPIALKLLVLLFVPLVSLVGLWAFAAGLTGGDGLRLLEINNLVSNLADPSEQVNIQLQRERLASVELLAGKETSAQLARQRETTTRVVDRFKALSKAQRDVSPEMTTQLAAVYRDLDRLGELRGKIDKASVGALEVINGYSVMVDSVFRMYDKMILVPDMSLYRQARAVTMLGEAKEILSRERAMIVAVLAVGEVGGNERTAFTQMVATRRLLFSQALSHLDTGLRRPYEQLASSPVYTEFLHLEDAVRGPATATGLPASAATWPIDAENLWVAVERNQFEAVQGMVKRVTPAAVNTLVKIGVAGGIGLIAVVMSIALSFRFRRRLARELAALRAAATELSDVRLAGLVERLRKGSREPERIEPLDVPAMTSEVRDIVQAFNIVQSTAVEAAVGQARLRHGVNQVFVNLARRNQSLLHRQLLQLDAMERGSEDPETLEDLFKLDHLTTRMRRHAESLIILSDQTPGRGWRSPVPMIDVLRAAVAEVEEYARVEVLQPPRMALAGHAVTDVVHLVAELVENATLFSPPPTRVDLRSTVTPHGLTVEVEDRGFGIARADLDAFNERLASMPEFDLAESDRLGLFVVGRLAARHDIRVMLSPSPFGGLTAAVMLPAALLTDQLALTTGGR